MLHDALLCDDLRYLGAPLLSDARSRSPPEPRVSAVQGRGVSSLSRSALPVPVSEGDRYMDSSEVTMEDWRGGHCVQRAALMKV